MMDSSVYYERLEALSSRIQRVMTQAEMPELIGQIADSVTAERRQNRNVDYYARNLELLEQEIAQREAKAAA